MKQFWLPVFLLFSTGHLYAQNTWRLSGHVRNETGEPLPGSLVQIDDSTGVVADTEGYFQIQSPARPVELTARCLGYFPRRILLQNSDFQNKRANIEVALTDQEMVIQEISITAKKVEVLAKENFSTDIYDYTFAGENLLLLVRERKRYFVRLVSESGEQLDELQLAGQPAVLHRSCTGSLHLAGDAFAQELTVNGRRLDTFPRYPLQKFRQFVLPCVQQSRGYYFFKVNGLFNKSVTYFYFDPERKRHLLASIKDAAGEAEAMDAYGAFRSNEPLFIYSLGGLPAIDAEFSALNAAEPANVFSDAALQQYANSNQQLAHWSWLQVVKIDSVYAPLLKIGDTLLLFDHVRGELRRFDVTFSNETVVPLQYHREKGWKKELLKDEATQVVYGHFAPDSRHHLCRIELATGKTSAGYPLPEVPHISQNFKMRNGFLYFLGRTDANVPNASLYKINIFQKIASK